MGGRNTVWAPFNRVLQRFSNPGANGIDPNAAPSMDYLLHGLQDHRWPYNKRGCNPASGFPAALGWHAGRAMVANYVPSAVATANIAALANVVNGAAMALVGASGAGITVCTAGAPATYYPGPNGGNTIQSSGVVIDGLPSLATFGASGGDYCAGFFNRSTYVGRALSITGSAGGAGGAFIASGYDVYGFPMTEQITVGAGAVTQNGKKAFKGVVSVTPQFTDAHNYSVGTADIFGFGLLASYFGDVQVFWNSTLITANTGFTAADTTSPATSTTGDVRGTYATQSASDGAKRLQMFVTPSLGSIASNPTTGLFGQPQA